MTYGYGFSDGSGYVTSKYEGSTSSGIKLDRSSALFTTAVQVASNGTHGIEACNSYVKLYAAVAGSGNAGAGVYAHSGSVVHIKHGSAPTLTGTVGNFSTDGTTEASTWAAIDGGTRVVDLNELTMCKETT